MEEQNPPVQQETVVVASTKKHSWSKKERLALYVAGVFALVGIGFGGFTFYNQVILNAAGEDSLGSDVVVDLPPANESPYFTIKNILEQDVFIVMKGEAMRTPASGAQREGEIASGWRIEQTTTPLDDNSWKVVAQHFDAYDTARRAVFSDGFTYGSLDTNHVGDHVRLSSNLVDRSSREQYVGVTGSAALNRVTVDDTTNAEFLQPGNTYYFRASRQSYQTDGNGNSTAVWTPQGNSVQVTTKQYSDLGFSATNNNSTNVKFTWNGSDEQLSSLTDWNTALGIMRAEDIKDFYSPNTVPEVSSDWDNQKNPVIELPQDSTRNYIMWGKVSAGTREIVQKKDTSYFYALVALRSSSNYTITNVLSEPVLISTINSTDKPFISSTLSPNVVPADKIKDAVITFKNSDTSTGEYDAYQWSRLVDASGEGIGRGCSNYINDITSISQPVSYSLDFHGQYPCEGVKPGSYTIRTEFNRYSPRPFVKQIVDTPITFSKVDPAFSATYASTSVKKGKDVVINLTYKTNDSFDGNDPWARGTFKIINLNTKKTVKTFSWNPNASLKKKITLKGVKKGSYNLALVYTADSKQGIYKDKTINLPKLTVK